LIVYLLNLTADAEMASFDGNPSDCWVFK